MGIFLSEVLSVKFYDLKNGKEITPYIPPKEDENKKLDLEKLRKLTGYHYPELCPSCGEYYEGYSGHYEIDGDVKCCHCVKTDDRLNLPHFTTHIPEYVDGATRRILTFKDTYDLYDKMKDMLNNDEILVKSDNSIMSQSTIKSYWWVFGYINNYDMSLLNIPKFNSSVYNKDNTINIEKFNKWVEGKDIIKGKKDED